MKTYLRSATAAAVLVLASAGVAAAQTAQQTVSVEVQAINVIAVSGDPAPLVVSGGTPGVDPDPATDGTTTYDITTNETNKTIQVVSDTDLPAGITLTVELAQPTGATSAGPVTLSTTAQNAVTGISTLAETGLGITYTLSATAAAGPLPAQDVIVTLTII